MRAARLALLGLGFARALERPSHCGSFPTLLWGGRDYFGQAETYEFTGTNHVETAQLVDRLSEQEGGPEVAVVFVLPSSFHDHQLTKESFPSLHAAISASPSSKVLPCVTRSSASSTSVLNAFSFSTPTSESQIIPPHELKAHILGPAVKNGVARNGKLKVLVSPVEGGEAATPASVDALVSEVSSALASVVPEGRYLIVQAPEPHARQPKLGAHIPRRVLLIESDDDDDDPNAYYPKSYLYATPNLVAGLLTGVFMLAVLYVGVQCLLALQTPTKWVKEKIPEGKQY